MKALIPNFFYIKWVHTMSKNNNKTKKKFKQNLNKYKGLIEPNFLNQLTPSQRNHLYSALGMEATI